MKTSKETYYWFKRRRYGYGWIPVKWQGWLTVVIFLAVVLFGTVIVQDTPKNTFTTETYMYLVIFTIATSLLVTISAMKGPKPKWRWGSKPTDDPEEDF